MATLSPSESRRLYSWWWDSRIPKNSKWLQENLTDMDVKVKAMIKLIEEDADSFARRAEMYYKKRPELMKLVEEFYRAYRALAERYDHATGALRQAHQTMAAAFPNQVPYDLVDESSSCSDGPEAGPHTPETLHLMNQLSSQSEHAAKAENDIKILQKTLSEIQAEKEAVHLQYHQSLEKLSELDKELNLAQEAAGGLSERATKADIEIKILKQALGELEAERDAGLYQYNVCLGRISSMENMLSFFREDSKGLSERAIKGETEANNLKQELCTLEAEKDVYFLKYKQCLEKISALEATISLDEENARILMEQIEKSETEAKSLKDLVAVLKEERKSAARQFKHYMDTISKMKRELIQAQMDAEILNTEILTGAAKVKGAEEQCVVLGRSNQSLRLQADGLVKKIAIKEEELSEKNNEMEKLQSLMQEEHLRFVQAEAALQFLQKLNSQSQEEQKALALEFKNVLQMLKDFEMRKTGAEDDIERVKEENKSLNELNFSCTTSIRNLQDEIFSMKEMKAKLEEEVKLKTDQSNALQQQVSHLENEIKGMNGRYQAIVEQVESVGLTPERLGLSVKNLQREKSRLEDICTKDREDREHLHEKLKGMGELSKANTVLESAVASLNGELESSRRKAKDLQESCHFLQGEKATLVAEKYCLLSQLQILTQNMSRIFEKNSSMESSLSGANIELERLRARSKSLEELCQVLNNEKSDLLNERGILVFQLNDVEERLRSLEKRFKKLEKKYSKMEKEKGSTTDAVEELRDSLHAEKLERARYIQSSESRMAGLESNVHLLQEETRLGKKEFEQELDKAVNAQIEIFVLQKFIQDLEEKNSTIYIECQRHVEASKFSDKLIKDLKSENLELQVEEEFLIEEIEKLRLGIYQVFRALQIETGSHEDKVDKEKVLVLQILNAIRNMKSSLARSKDEEHQLLVENSVLVTLLGALRSEGAQIESEKLTLDQEYKVMEDRCATLENDKHELLEIERQLRLEATEKEKKEGKLEAEMDSLQCKLMSLQDAYLNLQEEQSVELEERRRLIKEISDQKEGKRILEEENDGNFHEALAFSNLSMVLESFTVEKAVKVKALAEDLDDLAATNHGLKDYVATLKEKLVVKEVENQHQNGTVCLLDKELFEANDLNGRLRHQLSSVKDSLSQKTMNILEVEEKLQTTEELYVESCKIVEELKMENHESKIMVHDCEKQILQLSEVCMDQKKEMSNLGEANETLESEVGVLCETIEEYKIREGHMCSELQERSKEFELWEAEATSFFFDLHNSVVREVFLEDKVHELTGVCKRIKAEDDAKSEEIKRMKERVSILESEVGGLTSQLGAYAPSIASLRENVISLQRNALLRNKLVVEDNPRPKDDDLPNNQCQRSSQDYKEDQSALLPCGILELEEIQTMIKEVEKTVIGETKRLSIESIEKEMVQETEGLATKESTEPLVQIEEVKSTSVEYAHEYPDDNPKMSKPDKSLLTKDIPLDQVSNSSPYGSRRRRKSSRFNDQTHEILEAAEQHSLPGSAEEISPCPRFPNSRRTSRKFSFEVPVEEDVGIDKLEVSRNIPQPCHNGKKEKILERLATDAQKLSSLHKSVQDLHKKAETNKKSKKINISEHETMKQQLHEVEEAVVQLINVNDQLKKDIKGLPSTDEEQTSTELQAAGNMSIEQVTEQACKGSEKIERLQFELQNVEYFLVKLEGEKKRKGRHGFYVSRTGLLLRDFIYSGISSSERRKKSCLYGCMRPSDNVE